MPKESKKILNRQTRVTIALALSMAIMLLLLSTWNAMMTVEAADSPNGQFSQSANAFQLPTGTLTHTLHIPILRRDPSPTTNLAFADNFSNSASGWIIGEGGDCKFEYVSGVYRIIISDDGGHDCVAYNTFIPKTTYGDFRVKVRRTSSGSRELRYGFYFGAGTSAEEDRWFLEIFPHKTDCDGSQRGYFWLSAREDDKNEFFEDDCTSDINTDTNGWNDLRVIREKERIQIYINGKRKADYDDDDFDPDILESQGFFDLVVVGVDGISDSNPGVVEFDDFVIFRP